MVRGLEKFKEHFSKLSDRYVLIGGTASALLMEEVGFAFRATKDLDIVLSVEALDPIFVEAFWNFIKEGGYKNQQRSTGKEIFYRFDSPEDSSFPVMIELFSRIPDTLKLESGAHLTPIPMAEELGSLSAILLDDDYYQFIHEGKYEISGISVLQASHLIPLKARAWIDLTERKNSGEVIDEKDIRKHKNDVICLYQLLIPTDRIVLSTAIKQDMINFLDRIQYETPIHMKSLGLPHINFEELMANLKVIYQIG